MSKNLAKKVVREYEICRCLVTNIQSVTGHKTHEIISFLSSMAENCIKINDFNVDKFIDIDRFQDNSVKDYAYYPGTKVYLGVSITRTNIDAYENVSRRYIGENMLVKYKFYTPTTIKKFTQEQFDDVVVDGLLTDFSMDFDPPSIKKPKTLVQRKKEMEEYEKREQARLVKSLKQDLKEYLKEAMLYEHEAQNMANSKSSRLDAARRFRQLERYANQTLARLRELGDKTHEVLLTPTDSKNNQTEGKCQTKTQAVQVK